MRGLKGHRFAYSALLGGTFIVALAAGWTPLGTQIDNYVYDWIFRLHRPDPWPTESIVLAIDEGSLKVFGGLLGVRKALADGLKRIAPAHPKAVAVDYILADATSGDSDDRLEEAFRQTRNLVLPCDLLPDRTGWDDPLPRFRRWAAAVGHVHLEPDLDGVGRALLLEKVSGHDRRWALSLEAFRVSRGAVILETQRDLEVAGTIIPASNYSNRLMRIRYRPEQMPPIPMITLKQLADRPSLAHQFTGKIVFAGMTAQTAV